MASAASSRSGDFFYLIPFRSVVIFHAAVFCIFAPIGLLVVSSIVPERPWLSVGVNLLVSGLIAVSWAATFTISRWFAIGGITGVIVLSTIVVNSFRRSFSARQP